MSVNDWKSRISKIKEKTEEDTKLKVKNVNKGSREK